MSAKASINNVLQMEGRAKDMSSRQIVVPHLGEGVKEVSFIAWLKGTGQAVAAGEPVAEVMSDKANVEIEAPIAGVLRHADVAEDDLVSVGAVIGTVES